METIWSETLTFFLSFSDVFHSFIETTLLMLQPVGKRRQSLKNWNGRLPAELDPWKMPNTNQVTFYYSSEIIFFLIKEDVVQVTQVISSSDFIDFLIIVIPRCLNREGKRGRNGLFSRLDSLPALVSLETQEWESRAEDAKILKLMMLLFKDPHEVRGEDKKMLSSSSKESASSSPSTRGVTSSSSLYINCSCCVVCDSRFCYWLKLTLGREWVSLRVSHFHFLPFSASSLHSSEAVFVLFFSFMFFLV